MLSLRVDRRTSASEVRWRAEAKIEDIELKLADLPRTKAALVELATCCEGREAAGEPHGLLCLDVRGPSNPLQHPSAGSK